MTKYACIEKVLGTCNKICNYIEINEIGVVADFTWLDVDLRRLDEIVRENTGNCLFNKRVGLILIEG